MAETFRSYDELKALVVLLEEEKAKGNPADITPLVRAIQEIVSSVKSIQIPEPIEPKDVTFPEIQKVEVTNPKDDAVLLRDIAETYQKENEKLRTWLQQILDALGSTTLDVRVTNPSEIGSSIVPPTFKGAAGGGGAATTVSITDFVDPLRGLTIDAAGKIGVNNFPLDPADQLVHATNLDVPVSTLVKPGDSVNVGNFPVSQPVTGPLTDAQLRAVAVPVSGPLTDTQLRASAVPVTGSLTDTQLRAVAVPVSGFPADQLVHAANLDAAVSTLAKASTQMDGTQVTQVSNLAATFGTAQAAPEAYTVLDRLAKLQKCISTIATEQTLRALLQASTPQKPIPATATLLHRR